MEDVKDLPNITSNNSKRYLYLFIILLLLIALITSATFLYIFLNKNTSSTETTSQNEVTPTPTVTNEVIPQKIVYLKSASSDVNELWSMNLDGSDSKNLNIQDVSEVYNYGKSKYFTYSKNENSNTIFIDNYNLTDNQTINIPDGADYFSYVLARSISPNSKYLLYDVHFGKKCVSEGGCEDYDSPTYKTGLYLYDLINKTSKYIGSYDQVNNWSVDGSKAYFYESDLDFLPDTIKSGLYEFDTATGDTSLVNIQDQAIFSSREYKTDSGTDFICSSPNTSSPTTLIISQNGQEKYKATSPFADLQPMLKISPDQKYGLFFRTPRSGTGNLSTVSEFYTVDLTSITVKKIFTSTESSTMSSGYWYDDENYVYLSGFPGKNNVSVYNVISGKHTDIVNSANVTSISYT